MFKRTSLPLIVAGLPKVTVHGNRVDIVADAAATGLTMLGGYTLAADLGSLPPGKSDVGVTVRVFHGRTLADTVDRSVAQITVPPLPKHRATHH